MNGARRLVLDTRGECDRHDIRTLVAALGARPSATHLTYEHLDSAHELLIGLAAVLGWAYGAGGDWQRRSTPAITAVVGCSCAGTARSPAAIRPNGNHAHSLSPPGLGTSSIGLTTPGLPGRSGWPQAQEHRC